MDEVVDDSLGYREVVFGCTVDVVFVVVVIVAVVVITTEFV